MITRSNFALNYSGYDAALPPPLGFITHPYARHRQSMGRMYRAGAQPLNLSQPRKMMDPSDPSTWQREYRFTQ